jgi:hypothetical protein
MNRDAMAIVVLNMDKIKENREQNSRTDDQTNRRM